MKQKGGGMKKLLGILILFSGALFAKEATWRLVGSFPNKSADEVWSIITDVVLEKGYEFTVIERGSGYLKTGTRIEEKDDMWLPAIREYWLEVKMKTSPPYDVKIRVPYKESQGLACCFIPLVEPKLEEAEMKGNYKEKEEEIIKEIQIRLQK